MKRITLIFILFFYLFSTTGIAVNIHYCGGRVSSVDFILKAKDSCPCGSKKVKKSCCKDKKHFFKVKDSHKVADKNKLNLNHSIIQETSHKALTGADEPTLEAVALNYREPPLLGRKHPLFLFQRSILL
ncbi:MAG: HYC_CC_PP family protein [Bacteroidia bacterium]